MGRDGKRQLEQFCLANEPKLATWPEEARISHTTFNRIRTRGEMNVDTLARLVRAATKLLGRPVMAAEIADLGEDEPAVGTTNEHRLRRYRKRKVYDTRADRKLAELGVSSTVLASVARVTRPTVTKFRRGKGTLRVSNLAAIVRAVRKLTGLPIRATDLCDVGESP